MDSKRKKHQSIKCVLAEDQIKCDFNTWDRRNEKTLLPFRLCIVCLRLLYGVIKKILSIAFCIGSLFRLRLSMCNIVQDQVSHKFLPSNFTYIARSVKKNEIECVTFFNAALIQSIFWGFLVLYLLLTNQLRFPFLLHIFSTFLTPKISLTNANERFWS